VEIAERKAYHGCANPIVIVGVVCVGSCSHHHHGPGCPQHSHWLWRSSTIVVVSNDDGGGCSHIGNLHGSVELVASTSLGAPVENVVILVTFTVVGAVELVASTSLDTPVENVVILVTFMAVGAIVAS